MMQSNETNADRSWLRVCGLEDILPDTGVCCLVGPEQVAIFRVGKGNRCYAIGNFDPFSRANVLSRGIVGDRGGRIKVASPIYKQSFCLETGVCLDDPSVSVPTYEVRIAGSHVELKRNPTRTLRTGNTNLLSEVSSV